MSSLGEVRSPPVLRPLEAFPGSARRGIHFVLTDIDDTLTDRGRLGVSAYAALEELADAGIAVVPVTGRPAGWCDLIARLWPVEAVIGENGAFYFRYDRRTKRMIRRYWADEAARQADRVRLEAIAQRVFVEVPGAAYASDQAYRVADVAIDYREDVDPLPAEALDEIVRHFVEAGATAKISSIHVNAWYGDYDKLAMSKLLFTELFGIDLDSRRGDVAFIGDSPNDEPLFGFFPHSVAVANIERFIPRLRTPPAYVTSQRSGEGFAEFVDTLLAARKGERAAGTC
jgi:HAD superfamily hydrolase (TIGR01484 family)